MLRNDRLLGASLVDTIFDRPKYAFSHLINRETTNSINCAASLINLSGYYHWFIDFLSRIQGIRAYEEETGLHPKILIRPNPSEWMKTSLRLMGYLDQAIQWDNRTTRVNQLIIPTIPREMGPSMNTIHSPSHIEGMRNRILESADPPDQSDFSKYVYISREDTNNRRVINKRELFTALPDSFESYCLSELSLRDQICLFSSAEAVVAPHGAGLVNLLWGSDMDIVELHGVLDNSYFFQLAQNLGHSYASVQCEQDARDLVVDTDALKRRVDCLLSGQPD